MSTRDGVTHVVVMGSRWWECLDWMVEHRGLSLDDIAEFCMRFRRQYPEDSFTALLQLYIELFMRDHRQMHFGLANEDLLEEERRQSTQ